MQGGKAIRAEAYSKYVEHRIAEGDATDPPESTADCRVDGGFGRSRAGRGVEHEMRARSPYDRT